VSSNIIVGIDGSEFSFAAYRWALEEGRRRNSDVTAVFAWQLPLIGIPGAFDREELEVDAQRYLNELLDQQPPANGVNVERVVVQGDPSSSLIEACQRADADLLVLGTRGRGGFSGLLLGSVGQECAAHAPCPVVICGNGEHSS
jgi:nucleotide-binding universal stress UspA family protein